MVRNGGRTGIAFTAGFRWALPDRDNKKVEKKQTPVAVTHVIPEADCRLRAEVVHGGVEPAEQTVDPLNAGNQENTKSANEMSKDFDLSGISMSSDFNNDNITTSDKNSQLRDTAQVKNQVFAKSQTDFNTLRYDMLGVTSSDGVSNTLSQEARKTTVGTQQTKTVIKSMSKANSAKSRNLARYNQLIGG